MKIRLLTTLTAALLAITVWANGTEIDGIYYEFDSSTMTASVTYTGKFEYSVSTINPTSTAYTGDITIPNSVTDPFDGTTYSVTSIGARAFYYCYGLTSITIPESVTCIEDFAFKNCSGLTSVTIGNSVSSIGYYAFEDCTGLTSVTIGNSVTTIGSGAFAGCTGLTSVTIGISVTQIGSSAFLGCSGLTSITIPASVTTIGNDAFFNCYGLTGITIPSSVTSIGSTAFGRCTGLTNIKVVAGNTTYDSRDNCNAIIETESNTLIAGCMSTIIPASVTSIEDYAFYSCTGLTSITIPNSVTSIGSYVFNECTSLKDVYALHSDPDAYNCSTDACFRYTATLHVPAGCKEAYASTAPWSYFDNIMEDAEDVENKGDLNGDGAVNVGDVTTLVNMILGKAEKSDAADLNGDGAVNVGDVTTLVNMILGKQ